MFSLSAVYCQRFLSVQDVLFYKGVILHRCCMLPSCWGELMVLASCGFRFVFFISSAVCLRVVMGNLPVLPPPTCHCRCFFSSVPVTSTGVKGLFRVTFWCFKGSLTQNVCDVQAKRQPHPRPTPPWTLWLLQLHSYIQHIRSEGCGTEFTARIHLKS